MTVLTSTEGQKGLPRYFAAVFAVSKALKNGRLDFVMPDGRLFRVDGPNPGPVGEIVVRDPDVFARLIREGDLGVQRCLSGRRLVHARPDGADGPFAP